MRKNRKQRQHQQKQGQNQHPGQNPQVPWYQPPQTAQRAHQIAQKEALTETRPLERTIQANARASRQREHQLGGWWNEYLNTVSGAQAQTQQAYADAAAQQQGLLASTSAADTANTQRLTGEEAQSAALRGVAPTGEAAQRDAAAQAQRNYLGAAYGATTADKGANQFAYLANERRIGAGQKVKSRMDEQKRGRSIQQDLKSVREERGKKTLGHFQEQRKSAAENALKRQAFGLEKKEAGTAAAKEAREAREDAEANRRANEAQANENKKTRREGKPGSKTPSEKNDAKEGRRNAWVTANNLYKAAKKKPKSNAEWAAFTQLIAAEEEISPTEAQQAVKRLRKKKSGAKAAPSQEPTKPHFGW